MTSLTVLRVRELAKKMMKTMKKNEAQSAHAESTHKGVNQHSKDVTQTPQQRPDLPTVALTWHACKIQGTYTPPEAHPLKRHNDELIGCCLSVALRPQKP